MEFPWLTEKPLKVKTYDFRGTLYPFQHKGTLFLAKVRRALLTDRQGLGKTCQFIASADIMRKSNPDLQFIVLTVKSIKRQWKGEFKRFYPNLKVEIIKGSAAERKNTYAKFARKEIDAIIMNYELLGFDVLQTMKDSNGITIRDYKGKPQKAFTGPLAKIIRGKKFVLVLDEIQKCKTLMSQKARASHWLSNQAWGVKGLTASPIHKDIIDLYGIFKCIDQRVFKNKKTFMENYCHVRENWFTKYEEIVGYKNHQQLFDRIRGITFGRPKSIADGEMPQLLCTEEYVELSKEHRKLYKMIENGIDLTDESNTKPAISSLIDCQSCVNAASSVSGYSGKEMSPKLDRALELIQEDLGEEKTIIYCSRTKTLDVMEKMLYKAKIPVYPYTGKQSEKVRNENKDKWESTKGRSVLLMSTAGEVGLNLQKARFLITIDRPWSIGMFEQIEGRFERLGSDHKSILEINIIAEDTIDEIVMDVLRDRREDAEKVFGKTHNKEILKEWRNRL